MIGKTLSHYKIEGKLGEGRVGVAYRALDQKLGRAVVLKVLPPGMPVSTADRERFLRDAATATELEHPNIAAVYGIEEDSGETFIVREFIDGETLDKKSNLPPEEIVTIAKEIAEGLRAAHAQGLIHRDIKSENIMITTDGHVKITDFGVAGVTGDSKISATGSQVRDLAFASPEQIQSEEVDHRTDLWSFGVVLYELISGHLPFQGDYDAALLYEILNTEPLPLRQPGSKLPDRVLSLVSALLEKDPARRPASADEVIEWLSTDPTEIRVASPAGEVSLSVLYFDNLGPNKESEYLCAGITEDIIAHLSKVKGLNVVSRHDVLPFRDHDIDTRSLGESLGVDYMLEGDVRKTGKKLRVTTRLTDVDTGFEALSERFEGLPEDILDIENDVVRKTVAALGIAIDDKATLAARPTDDVRAYDFYMRGRDFLSRRGKRNAEAAVKMLKNAIKIDPNFVVAYTGLAEAYAAMYTYYDGDDRWLAKVIENSTKALDLDPELVEAQFSLGIVYFHQKEFDKARQTFEEVIHKRAFYYDAYWWLGVIADIVGDFDAALDYYEKAAAVKPYSVEPWLYMNMTHRRKGDIEAAKMSAKRFLEVGIRKLEIDPDDAVTLSRFAVIYTLFGERQKASAALTRILESHPDDGLVLYNCASTYALLGDHDQAIRCLRMALDNGFRNVREWVKSDPDFDDMREMESFKELLVDSEGGRST